MSYWEHEATEKCSQHFGDLERGAVTLPRKDGHGVLWETAWRVLAWVLQSEECSFVIFITVS